MNRRLHSLGIVKDDGAQGLTEFAIIIPVVLLFFFAILQYFVVVRTAQLANYAAYVAARSYAVQAAVDDTGDKRNATGKAITAAAMAFAPVAHLVPGEIRSLNLTPHREGLLALGEGFLVARYIRLNPRFGGSVTVRKSGAPDQINVEVNYPQPIYMPGLSELWGIVGGGSKMREELRPLSEGLSGITGLAYNTQQKIENFFDEAYASVPSWARTILDFLGVTDRLEAVKTAVSNHVANLVDTAISKILPFPYVNVRGKCSMGYEDWGSSDVYRPRMPSTVSDKSPVDEQLAAKMQKLQDAANNYKEAVKTECKRCCEAQNAYKTWQYYQKIADNCKPPKNPKAKDPCPGLRKIARRYEGYYRDAERKYNAAYGELDTATQNYNKAIGQSIPVKDRCTTTAAPKSTNCKECN